VSRQTGEIEHDPARLAETESRIALINDLRRKYGESIEDVIKFGENAVARSASLESLLGRADRIDGELSAARAVVDERGATLREGRRSASARVTQQALIHLSELGLGNALLEFAIEEAEPDSHGADAVSFAFASDERLTAGPIHKTASGGELSRLVLALRLAAGAGQAPIVAFDEVDAGVGGSTALALGKKLAALSVDRQVFCVTHLPQVAAFADAHFVVSRDGIDASVARVDGDRRLQELSRMLSGLPESDRGRDHAAELLALAVSTR
jgi:DNA repair protein RecN (Recombination protein N)